MGEVSGNRDAGPNRDDELARLIRALDDALERSHTVETALRALARVDRIALSRRAAATDAGAWRRGFTLATARKLSDMLGARDIDAEITTLARGTMARMAALAARLPGGVALDEPALMVGIYNQCRVYLSELGTQGPLADRLLREACALASKPNGRPA